MRNTLFFGPAVLDKYVRTCYKEKQLLHYKTKKFQQKKTATKFHMKAKRTACS